MNLYVDKNQQAFLELLRAGLWEIDARLSEYNNIEYEAIMKMAEEQTVVGLVTAGLERVSDVTVPKEMLLQFIGSTLQIEQRNKAMNEYVAWVIEKLRKEDVYAILVKGQGIAQCYEKPLWRSSGDIDLLLSDTNYEKAKKVLLPLTIDAEDEDKLLKHSGMTMEGGFVVELHGTLHSRVSRRIDKVIEEVQNRIFFGGEVRSWMSGNTRVFLPSPNNDVIFVFCHILQHFFGGGIGLRQISDWCRLLWTYKDSLNHELMESRIRKAGMMKQWKSFAALAVDTLGMPADAMPLYSSEKKWGKKADKILRLIMESGNFGHGRDKSYKQKYPNLIEYLISFWVYSKYSILQFQIFPLDAVRGWNRILKLGVKAKLKGIGRI